MLEGLRIERDRNPSSGPSSGVTAQIHHADSGYNIISRLGSEDMKTAEE